MADVTKVASDALTAGGGVIRLAPNSVPRSLLQPGRRSKLPPAVHCALGMRRGGIEERQFASTMPDANDGHPDEGLSPGTCTDRRC